MRTLRIFAHISLDGVIAPGGQNDDSEYANGGWTAPYRSPDGLAAVIEAQGARFDLVLGRRTYDLWTRYWPKAPKSPIADSINGATKYVATHRPESLAWGPAESLGADVVDGVRRIKSQDGPDLVLWGSSTVSSRLLEGGVVEEVVVFVYPLLLGRGTRFFSDFVAPRELALVSTKTMSTGVIMSTYRYVGALRTG